METKKRGGFRQGSGAKKKGERKKLIRSIPIDRYNDLAASVDEWLDDYRKEERVIK